nr:four helix bundle protein [Bacteroides fragilis]
MPVYKAAYDLLRSVYEKTGKIPRDVKYTLVEVLKKDLTEIMVMIYRANATTGKLPYIERARDLVVGVKVRLRLLQDMRHISVKQYAAFAQQVELLSKQLSAWHDYARRQDEKSQEKI